METKIIKLSEINISNAFWRTPPKPSKIANCYEYFLKHRRFDRDIMVDEKMTLFDGYVAYMVAKMVGCQTVRVKITDNKKIEVAA